SPGAGLPKHPKPLILNRFTVSTTRIEETNRGNRKDLLPYWADSKYLKPHRVHQEVALIVAPRTRATNDAVRLRHSPWRSISNGRKFHTGFCLSAVSDRVRASRRRLCFWQSSLRRRVRGFPDRSDFAVSEVQAMGAP